MDILMENLKLLKQSNEDEHLAMEAGEAWYQEGNEAPDPRT